MRTALVNGPGPRFEVRNSRLDLPLLYARFIGRASPAHARLGRIRMGFFDFIRRWLFPPPPTRSAWPLTGPSQSISSVTGARGGRPAPPKPRTLNLDAAQFAPMSSADALAQARASTTVRSNPWWGRLDTIPPASDERTLLIDRSLVAYGLLNPDDLVEIHKIGDRMLEITGEEALTAERAQEAVKASAAEAKRLKEQKKAEAAERKRKYAAEVARRKAEDIVFLGRGVSRGLADRRANVEKLLAARLPVLASPADLAQALGISISRLRWLAFHSDAAERIHYVRFTVPKKTGGVRELAAPHRILAAAQRWIFQNILGRLPTHAAAHGFVRGRSIRTNALVHVGRDVLVNADLKDFFPTITFRRVKGAMEQLGYSPAAATILALLCTESPRRTVEYAGATFHVATGPRALPQGACTSPALSNLIARRLDSRLSGIAAKLGWHYTRYADDLSFSADAAAEPKKMTGYLLARVRHIAQDEGFLVNEGKTRVLKQSSAMAVTGVIVNRRPGVSRRQIRRLRAILHNAGKHGLNAQNRARDAQFEARLRGQIAFVQMINPDQGGPLLAALNSLSR
jgi:RNA-directed DNA polymerase